MGIINFTIKGLAVCYRKDTEPEVWNIVFPTDDLHKIKFSWTKKDGTKYEDEIANKSVTITSTDSEPPADGKYEDDTFVNQVINLTSRYLHCDGLRRRGDYQGKPGEKILQIRHAKLSVTPEDIRSERLNYVFPFDSLGDISLVTDENNPTNPQKFAKLVRGSINLKAQGKIKIEIDGVPAELGENDKFEIDNDCHGESKRNDFQLYQDLFANKNDDRKRFEMISIIDPNIFDTESTNTKTDLDLNVKFLTDPPPLICDTVRISNTNDI